MKKAKTHLYRAESVRQGVFCGQETPRRAVLTKAEFLAVDPKHRCSKCGLIRDVNEETRRKFRAAYS